VTTPSIPTTPPERRSRRAPSLVLLLTGDGKGKTTAAMGTVLRGLARGWSVSVVQFIKSGRWNSGEGKLLRGLGTEWHEMGDGFSWDSEDLEHSAFLARQGWELAKDKISSGRYNLVLLDEVTYPLNWGWIDEKEVVAVIRERPEKVNLILTGRAAPGSLVEVADTVSEVRKVKHAFDAGIRAAKGIDF
jgi:cob(I)alamin adenosyltransferase